MNAQNTLQKRAENMERRSDVPQDAKEVLADAVGFLQSFFQLSPDMLCIASEKGHFIQVNAAWTTTLGWEPGDLEGKAWLDFVHPEDKEPTIKAASVMHQGDLLFFRNRFRNRRGDYRWLLWTSTRWTRGGLAFAIARDVTGTVQLIESLQKSEREFQEALRHKDRVIEDARRALRDALDRRLGAEEAVRALTASLDEGRRELDRRHKELMEMHELFQRYVTAGLQPSQRKLVDAQSK